MTQFLFLLQDRSSESVVNPWKGGFLNLKFRKQNGPKRIILIYVSQNGGWQKYRFLLPCQTCWVWEVGCGMFYEQPAMQFEKHWIFSQIFHSPVSREWLIWYFLRFCTHLCRENDKWQNISNQAKKCNQHLKRKQCKKKKKLCLQSMNFWFTTYW